MIFLQRKRWEETTKTDYYLAQIAAEIRVFREGFNKNPKPVRLEDLVLRPKTDDPPKRKTKSLKFKKARSKKQTPIDTAGRKPVEQGPEAMEDPKWRQVNDNAKKAWAARFGIQNLEDLSPKKEE
jgi:hypothetical protein